MMRHAHHAHPGHVVAYPKTISQRLYVLVFVPVIILACIAVVGMYIPPLPGAGAAETSAFTMFAAALATLGRITIAYLIALACAVPLALLTTLNRTVEAILLPLFDVFESVPILSVFPMIVVLFIGLHFLEGAALFILYLNMLWNLVFALVGGLQIIPKDITYAAHVFGVRGVAYVRKVLLPAVFPQLVTGSILAVADGWNIIIVAEALHSYVPAGSQAGDLFGLGSILVSSAAESHNGTFILALVVLVVMIGLINFFVWQRLLHLSQRFRFE